MPLFYNMMLNMEKSDEPNVNIYEMSTYNSDLFWNHKW